MKKLIEKRSYLTPQISSIQLDAEISLILNSAPGDPEDYNDPVFLKAPDFFSIDPYKSNIG